MQSEIVRYPMFEAAGIDVDERYRDIQKQGLMRIQLPHGDPCWLATRYNDVRNVFYDHRRFSRSLGLSKDAPGMFPSNRVKDPSLLLNMDPPEHTRIRTLAAGAFSPKRIQEFEGWIQGYVDELLDQMVAAGQPADFVSIYSLNLPLRVLVKILGIPQGEADKFRSYVDISSSIGVDEKARSEAAAHTFAFIRRLIAERREQTRDDLLSELVNARDQNDRLTEPELVSLAMALWHGGFKTTVWQLGTTVYTLMTHPQHWQELLEKPALLPAALTELWRWIPSFKYGVPFVRWAKEDVEFSDGTVVRAGEAVLPEFAVANRDESVYPNGWQLDFHREDPQPHLSFTVGPHLCMGQHLARMQIRLTVETLLRRFPKLALAIPASEVVFEKTSFMRSVQSLPLKW
jgi:cytochrome P450